MHILGLCAWVRDKEEALALKHIVFASLSLSLRFFLSFLVLAPLLFVHVYDSLAYCFGNNNILLVCTIQAIPDSDGKKHAVTMLTNHFAYPSLIYL